MINIGLARYTNVPTLGKGRDSWVAFHPPSGEIVKVSQTSRQVMKLEKDIYKAIENAKRAIEWSRKSIDRDQRDCEENGRRPWQSNRDFDKERSKVDEILDILDNCIAIKIDESKLGVNNDR